MSYDVILHHIHKYVNRHILLEELRIPLHYVIQYFNCRINYLLDIMHHYSMDVLICVPVIDGCPDNVSRSLTGVLIMCPDH